MLVMVGYVLEKINILIKKKNKISFLNIFIQWMKHLMKLIYAKKPLSQ